jgi:hypothetical protein
MALPSAFHEAIASADLIRRSLINTALHDWEKRLLRSHILVRFLRMLHASFEPAMGAVHALLCIFISQGIGRALIKCHDDVGPDAALNIHHIFGRENMAGTINMRLKNNTFLHLVF